MRPHAKQAVQVGVFRQGCALHPPRPRQQQRQRQRQKQRQKPAFRGMAGWVRLRGTLQVRPCKLGRAIHGAHAPATGPTLPSTDLRNLPGWHGLRLVCVSTLVNTVIHAMRRSTFNCRNIRFRWRSIHAWRESTNRGRETVEGGAVWACRTVGAMDGAIEPPWMGSRRVLQAHTAPPSPQKAQSRLLPLLRPLLWLWLRHLQVQGAALPNTPHYGRVRRCRAAAWLRRIFDYT